MVHFWKFKFLPHYRKQGKLRTGKVSQIALHFTYRWKSFAIPTWHLIPVKFKMYWRKSFATMTEFAKFANLFPRLTFPVYGMFFVLKALFCSISRVIRLDSKSSLYAFLRQLILHTFNYTMVTYGYFSLRSSDQDHCPQNELAIPMMYNFLQKGEC